MHLHGPPWPSPVARIGKRGSTPCSSDIDHLKVVNDTAGHGAGDALLVQLATLVRAKLADAVLTARFGGDELAVLFDDCTEAQGIAKCEELLESVRDFPFRWRGRTFDIGLSIGLTAFVPQLDSAAAELAKADVACRMAKREGRKRVHVYRASDVSVARHHGDMHLAATISEALDSGRFRLYAQPIRPLSRDAPGGTH